MFLVRTKQINAEITCVQREIFTSNEWGFELSIYYQAQASFVYLNELRKHAQNDFCRGKIRVANYI